MPVNRYGSYEFTGAQLKTIQEVITLPVFSLFSITYLGETFKWNDVAGFAFICGGRVLRIPPVVTSLFVRSFTYNPRPSARIQCA